MNLKKIIREEIDDWSWIDDMKFKGGETVFVFDPPVKVYGNWSRLRNQLKEIDSDMLWSDGKPIDSFQPSMDSYIAYLRINGWGRLYYFGFKKTLTNTNLENYNNKLKEFSDKGYNLLDGRSHFNL
jgi:hypothetical protein